jgi:hypothetical protein
MSGLGSSKKRPAADLRPGGGVAGGDTRPRGRRALRPTSTALEPTSTALEPTSAGAAEPIDLTGSPSPVARRSPRHPSQGASAPAAGEPCGEELPLR